MKLNGSSGPPVVSLPCLFLGVPIFSSAFRLSIMRAWRSITIRQHTWPMSMQKAGRRQPWKRRADKGSQDWTRVNLTWVFSLRRIPMVRIHSAKCFVCKGLEHRDRAVITAARPHRVCTPSPHTQGLLSFSFSYGTTTILTCVNTTFERPFHL